MDCQGEIPLTIRMSLVNATLEHAFSKVHNWRQMPGSIAHHTACARVVGFRTSLPVVGAKVLPSGEPRATLPIDAGCVRVTGCRTALPVVGCPHTDTGDTTHVLSLWVTWQYGEAMSGSHPRAKCWWGLEWSVPIGNKSNEARLNLSGS